MNKKTQISVSIPKKLIAKIVKDIAGNSRSEKLSKCAEVGFQLIINGASNNE